MVSPLDIVRDHNAGKTVREIAKARGVCRKRVARILKTMGIQFNRAERTNPNPYRRTDGLSLTDDQISRIRSGVPVREIAEEIGHDPKTVYAAMKRQGVAALRTLVMGELSEEAIEDWRTSPDTTEVVARRYGMAGSTFARKLKSQGIGKRPPLAVRRPASAVTSGMVKAKRSTLAITVPLDVRRAVLDRAVAEGESVNGLISRWVREGLSNGV